MTTPANTPSGSAVATTWSDNMALGSFLSAVDRDSVTVSAHSQQVNDSQRFWATPERPATSTDQEVLEIRLTSARLVNLIAFDVAIFPHIITLQYFDGNGTWQPFLNVNDSPSPVRSVVLDSFPQILPSVNSLTGHFHPQHSFSGHWRALQFEVWPVTTQRIRILLQRTTGGTAPVSTFGQRVDYSLAVRNFYFGYRVASKKDVPLTKPVVDSDTQYEAFTSVTDILGSLIQYQVRVNKAENILRNSADPATQNVIWKCEPQPFPWAVVNFFADTRDNQGNPQVIDRFYIEPLYDGPSVHLYWSNDDPTQSFISPTDPLPYPLAIVQDPNGVGGDVLHSGQLGQGLLAFVDVDNTGVAFDPVHQWWIGFKLNFKFSHGTENVVHPIFDCSAFAIALTPFGLRVVTAAGDTLALTLEDFDPATPLTCIVGYDGHDELRLNAQVGSVTYSTSMPLSVPFSGGTIGTLRVAGFQAPDPMVGDFDLDYLVLKIDTQVTDEIVEDFFADPAPYVDAPQFAIQRDPRSDNALLRYQVGWSDAAFPSGFIGGSPNRFGELVWNPVARDYVLRKGYFEIPPTKAKYWKFEFCGLVAEPYEVYIPVTRVTQTFTSDMWATSVTTKTSVITAGQSLQQTYPVNVSTLSQFDIGQAVQSGTGAASLGFQPTAARVIQDPSAQQAVGSIYWAWNFLPIASSVSATPIFAPARSHTYQQVDVQQHTKIAYFVGLVSLTAYRLDSLATDDTLRYVENFYDLTNVATDSNWILEADHHLSSGAANYAELVSKPLSSSRIVTAVQIAAQYSDPMQLLPDSDFNDPTHANWAVVGDAQLVSGVTSDLGVGSTLRISRTAVALTWGALATNYGTWDGINTANLSYMMLEQAVNNPQDSGGITSAPFSTPAGGRVAVAARVVATTDLTQPLYVQIIDDSTGFVLSQEQVSVKGHQITEWYTSYTIGDIPTVPWRWRDFAPTTLYPLWSDTFASADATILPPMDTGQQWTYVYDGSGNPLSLALQSHKATVTVAGQENYVETGTPWGSLQFTVGTVPAPPVGAVNKVTNPGFETNTAGWSGINGTTLVRVAGGTVGSFAGRLTSVTATLATGLQTSAAITGITPGAVYVFSLDLNPSVSLASGTFTVSWFNASSTLLSTSSVSSSNILAGSWSSLRAAFTAPATADHVTIQFDGGKIAVGATILLDNIYFGVYSEVMLTGFLPLFLDDQGVLNDASGDTLGGGGVNLLTSTGFPRAVQANDTIRIDIMPTYLVPVGKADFRIAANPDAVIWPYSLVVYLNGTWVRTFSHNLGAMDFFQLYGRVGQQFTNWSFSPFNYGILPGPVVYRFPRLDSGNWVDSTYQQEFLVTDGTTWLSPTQLAWDVSTAPEVPGVTNWGPPLTAQVNGAVIYTETQYWYGTLTAFVRNVANGNDGLYHGNLLCLDYDNQVFLDCFGNIIASGTNYGNLVPGGVFNNVRLTVVFAHTANVSIITRGGINPATNPDMLVALINGQIVGTWSSPLLQQWRGTKRGLAGDIFNIGGGSRPSAPNYTLDTSFRTFHWAPDASLVPAVPSAPTWDQVTADSTATYDQARHFRILAEPKLRARLMQFGQSTDTWDVDTLSMYVDPLVWSVSNDGGITFYNAYDIINNPYGVFQFPQSVVATSLGRQPGTSLVWKITSYAPDRALSSLVIRPWYAGPLSGITRAVGLNTSGPNLMPYDHIMPVSQDPAFQAWSKPIPRDWWYQFRLLQQSQSEPQPPPVVTTTNSYPGSGTFPGLTAFP